MAQDRLITAVAGAVLLAGGGAELISAPSLPAGLVDWVIGAAWAVAAVRVRSRRGPEAALGLLTAATWFAATALASHGPGPVLAIAYRAPLLYWLSSCSASTRSRAPARILVVVGALAALIGTTWGALGTGLIALVLAGLLARASRSSGPADLRRVDAEAAVLASLLGALWLVAAVGVLPGPVLQATTAVVLTASAWLLSRPSSGLTTAISSMVLDLGPASSQTSPVSASLARALADPGLRIRAYRPDLGWRDETGRPAADPGSDPTVTDLTAVDAPGGGKVVLLHGPAGVPETKMARAAAAAAALVLERVAVEALVQQEAEEVLRSTARLVRVNDEEREALAERLQVGPIARLGRVAKSLAAGDDGEVGPLRKELAAVTDELHRLAAGLNPIRISHGSLDEGLRALARTSDVRTTVILSGPFHDLNEMDAALAYFVSAECLTNVARHSGAMDAELRVDIDGTSLMIEVRDDGRGGASMDAGHGLQGLADRISMVGGVLEVHSPPGGPTVVRASAPRRSEQHG